MIADVPKLKLITPSIISEKLKYVAPRRPLRNKAACSTTYIVQWFAGAPGGEGVAVAEAYSAYPHAQIAVCLHACHPPIESLVEVRNGPVHVAWAKFTRGQQVAVVRSVDPPCLLREFEYLRCKSLSYILPPHV
eukprot:scaffold145606_cov35-Tisochrysis_lutea.AAC.2